MELYNLVAIQYILISDFLFPLLEVHLLILWRLYKHRLWFLVVSLYLCFAFQRHKTLHFLSKYCYFYQSVTNRKKIVESAALGVGGFFVKGLSTGVAAVEGAVKNEEGNVLKSTAVSVYQASPIAYVEKGQDLEIKNNQVFYLKFPSVNDTDIDIDDEE